MTTYKIPDDIIVTELDNNEAILLDMRNKHYYSLNETGLVIFRGIESNLAQDKIVEKIMSAFAILCGHISDKISAGRECRVECIELRV